MESSAVARYQRFFGAYQQIKQDASDAYRSKIAQFLGKVVPFVEPQKEVRRKTAPHFNLFEALGIKRKEQVQSRFLASLLDPRESHDQGDLFLRTFLEHIRLPDSLPQRLDGAVVRLESGIATYGRVDIVITLPDRRIIVIENKVDASEGEEQIARYQAWLRSKLQPTYGQHRLVFLTPKGREPETGDPADVLCVSYRQLGDWVSSLPALPERLHTVLTQYGENCRIIGGDRRYGMTTDNQLTPELHTFLMEPSNLETAFEVAEWIVAIRQEVFGQFWGRVKAQLSAALQRYSCQNQWEIYSDDNFADDSRLGIYWKRRPNRSRNPHNLQFAVGFVCITSTPDDDDAHYGIWRGKGIQAPARDVRDQALCNQLGADDNLVIDAEGQEWWVGQRYLHDLDLPDFCMMKQEDMLLLDKDNHAPDHPLAHKLASLLWDLFAKHRKTLEDLNTNYPYYSR